MARKNRMSVIRRLLGTEGKQEVLVSKLPTCERRVPETVRLCKIHWWKRAYGLFFLCAASAMLLSAQTFKTVVTFNGSDGMGPNLVSLVQGTDGNLYGTTTFGGAQNNAGTVFRLTPSGTLTTLHSFKGSDGAYPVAGLVLGTDGNFYGTTANGGNLACNAHYGCGTVFKITPEGTFRTLHRFNQADGLLPQAALVRAIDGNYYGTASLGGDTGNGTVFRITSGGTLTTLHSFNGTDGASPDGTLIQGVDGSFYGTTATGGTKDVGTVFKITSGGTLTTLHSFVITDGAYPEAALVQTTSGSFYGSTTGGGIGQVGLGTIFKMTQTGTVTTLHSFNGADGQGPYALVQGTDSKLYGVTSEGGTFQIGTVFEITRTGELTTLHSFNGTDGKEPYGVIQAPNGIFYGTTYAGGANDDGTVFSLSVRLGPFVETLPTSGKVGAKVIILGNNLMDATSVTFNDKAALFKVVSSTEITTTVPTGATSGTVEVKTPRGTLKSNVIFRVTP
jgi:uncharacterized repeat protein (TIGR03803 family)